MTWVKIPKDLFDELMDVLSDHMFDHCGYNNDDIIACQDRLKQEFVLVIEEPIKENPTK